MTGFEENPRFRSRPRPGYLVDGEAAIFKDHTIWQRSSRSSTPLLQRHGGRNGKIRLGSSSRSPVMTNISRNCPNSEIIAGFLLNFSRYCPLRMKLTSTERGFYRHATPLGIHKLWERGFSNAP